MSAQPWLEGVTARELALSVFRRPSAHAGLIAGRGALPDDVMDVMRLAKEAASHHGEPEYEDELHQAALYFVEHVLLGSGSDHYRVLGVARSADADEVREHYRLLVAIFHPDRCSWLAGDREDLTARINVAYRTLKDPVARAAYDTDHGRSRTIQMGAGAGTHAHRARDAVEEVPSEPFLSRFPPVVQRNFPQFVLGGVAVVGLLLVLGVYANRAPPEAIGMGAMTIPAGDGGGTHSHLLARAREPLLARVYRSNAVQPEEPSGKKSETDSRPDTASGLASPPPAPEGSGLQADRKKGLGPNENSEVQGGTTPVERSPVRAEMRKVAGADSSTGRVQDMDQKSSLVESATTPDAGPLRLASKPESGVKAEAAEVMRSAAEGPGEALRRVAEEIKQPGASTAIAAAAKSVSEDSGSGGQAGAGVDLPSTADRQAESPVLLSVARDATQVSGMRGERGASLSSPAGTASVVQDHGQDQTGDTQPNAQADTMAPSVRRASLPEQRDPGLSPDDTAVLLNQFSEAYRDARLAELMDLFAEDARSNSGKRANIQKDYADLFRLTQARDIEFHDFEWTLDGSRGSGKGAFVARVLANGKSTEGLHVGNLRLELVKVNGKTRIQELFHSSD